MIKGYDISNVNGPVDLNSFPYVEFVIAKVSQDATFVDLLFDDNRKQARNLGCAFGGYHYGDNKEQPDARASARRFVDLMGEQLPGEIAALDVEADSGHGGFDVGDHSDWVAAWGEEFTQLAGYKAKLYTSGAGIQDYGLNKSHIANTFDFWYAYWLHDPTQPNPTPPSTPQPFAEFKLWQYNADVIDKNYWLGTLAEFKATGKPGASVPVDYEAAYWTPMQKLLDAMVAVGGTSAHADAAFHAAVSNNITLHKIASGVEQP